MRRGLKPKFRMTYDLDDRGWKQFPDEKGIETQSWFLCFAPLTALEAVPRCEGD